jgi:hypothetical protein
MFAPSTLRVADAVWNAPAVSRARIGSKHRAARDDGARRHGDGSERPNGVRSASVAPASRFETFSSRESGVVSSPRRRGPDVGDGVVGRRLDGPGIVLHDHAAHPVSAAPLAPLARNRQETVKTAKRRPSRSLDLSVRAFQWSDAHRREGATDARCTLVRSRPRRAVGAAAMRGGRSPGAALRLRTQARHAPAFRRAAGPAAAIARVGRCTSAHRSLRAVARRAELIVRALIVARRRGRVRPGDVISDTTRHRAAPAPIPRRGHPDDRSCSRCS